MPDTVFNNPKSPMVTGFKCDRCGTPSDIMSDLVEQDGFILNRTHACYKTHSREEFEQYSLEDEDEFPLTTIWGGPDGLYAP